MSDRVDELRRQRALLEQHLAWLDREIAVEAAKAPASRVATPQPVVAPSRSIATDSATSAPATIATTVSVVNPVLAPSSAIMSSSSPAAPSPLEAEVLLNQYRVAPDSLKQDLRKGCFLYFALAFALLIIGVAILYFALSKG